jgi:hypothetical protein
VEVQDSGLTSRDACALIFATCLLGLILGACGDARQTETPRADSAPPSAVAPRRDPFRPGIRFHPATLRSGAQVGELVLDSIVVDGPLIDSTYFGVAWFRGQLQLSGWTHRHADSDVSDVALCFEVDSASAARLPRWLGDERRPWFCFGNRVAAARALGPPSEGVRATLVIDRLTIRVSGSDDFNTANFVRLVEGGPTASRPAG